MNKEIIIKETIEILPKLYDKIIENIDFDNPKKTEFTADFETRKVSVKIKPYPTMVKITIIFDTKKHYKEQHWLESMFSYQALKDEKELSVNFIAKGLNRLVAK